MARGEWERGGRWEKRGRFYEKKGGTKRGNVSAGGCFYKFSFPFFVLLQFWLYVSIISLSIFSLYHSIRPSSHLDLSRVLFFQENADLLGIPCCSLFNRIVSFYPSYHYINFLHLIPSHPLSFLPVFSLCQLSQVCAGREWQWWKTHAERYDWGERWEGTTFVFFFFWIQKFRIRSQRQKQVRK